MDSPYQYPITIRLEPVEGEPIDGEEMFVARCEHFPELAMAEESPGEAYDGLMAMIEKVWAVKVEEGEMQYQMGEAASLDFRYRSLREIAPV